MNIASKVAGCLLLLLGGWLGWIALAGASPAAPDLAGQTAVVAVPIEEIVQGDRVVCLDPETGGETTREVENTFTRIVDHVRHLTVMDETGERFVVETTDEHPLWIEPGDWVSAGDAVVGSELRLDDGLPATLEATERHERPDGVRVYNFAVADSHTYFVAPEGGDEFVLVHNSIDCGDAVGRIETLDPHSIRHSQSNVKVGLPDYYGSMKEKGWFGGPIDVVRMPDGGLTAVDNTRLAAAKLSNTPVQAVVRGFDEVFPVSRAHRSLAGETWGKAVLHRIGRQDPRWRQLYPLGSPFTGIHKDSPGFSP